MKNTLNELWQFLGGIYGGFAIGVVYRIFTLIRMFLKNKWINAVIDVVFYAIAGTIAAFTLLMINGGELRLFILLAIAFGAFLFIWASQSIVKTIFKICKKLLVKTK